MAITKPKEEKLYYPNTPTLRQLKELKERRADLLARAELIEELMRLAPVQRMQVLKRPELQAGLKKAHLLKSSKELKGDRAETLSTVRMYDLMIQFAEAAPYHWQWQCSECIRRAAANRQDAVQAAHKGCLECSAGYNTRAAQGLCPMFQPVLSSDETADQIAILIGFYLEAEGEPRRHSA